MLPVHPHPTERPRSLFSGAKFWAGLPLGMGNSHSCSVRIEKLDRLWLAVSISTRIVGALGWASLSWQAYHFPCRLLPWSSQLPNLAVMQSCQGGERRSSDGFAKQSKDSTCHNSIDQHRQVIRSFWMIFFYFISPRTSHVTADPL